MSRQAEIIHKLSDKELYANLYMTQTMILTAALILAFFLQGSVFAPFFLIDITWQATLIGAGFAGLVLLTEFLCYYTLPKKWFDDGGINERIFRRMPAVQIVGLSMLVAFSEELLFRGVLQTEFGIVAASLIFALIHIRYLSKWFLFLFVIVMSFSLGFLFMWTENLWTVITAHFLIDAVLGLLIRYRSR
ncbi:CPBP family intramembrane glutamic endopeptidase [Alkalicoccus saliphilus]|jgi:uncharacterized protein|uniref:CPBP family intramembrane metalloprotease n=1 Tax=Alkalicoccus saliphilus TaxID=200989 RepID=A0A2T4UAI5_9BACI|nr:type II CAAX endopeptidase family protein [Alkalicoccus saliphilus]PTL40392.1 CPBP family intramembrane metalloprotease [Alkalicoccus saliphilus]